MKDGLSLSVNNVSVRYRKKDTRSTAEMLRSILHKGADKNEFWALRNISFTLNKGDMLGVIGKNGAGKSTLMKAISGTLLPASGTIERNGKICALLELATGFDRDMTVRENVYLRGALLGYSKEYIDSRYDEIIDYADMRAFEDNPFRTLSSGMKSRIAFSIASIVDPDIIILDEVFAVGDGDFRRKSQATMQSIIGRGDTTALMVSHSLDSVRSQCNKVLWLHGGRMVMFGETNEVCDAYAEFLKTKKLPDTPSLRATQKTPKNNLRHSKRQRVGITAAYLAMLAAVLCGIFFWSQKDVIRAYNQSRNMPATELCQKAAEYSALEYELMGTDPASLSASAVEECREPLLAGDLSYSKAATIILEASELPNKPYNRATAELYTAKLVYREKLEALLDDYREEYEALPGDEQNGLLRYVYSQRKELFALEKSCDSLVQEVLDALRDDFEADGRPEEEADHIMNAYREEKSLVVAYYMNMLQHGEENGI